MLVKRTWRCSAGQVKVMLNILRSMHYCFVEATTISHRQGLYSRNRCSWSRGLGSNTRSHCLSCRELASLVCKQPPGASHGILLCGGMPQNRAHFAESVFSSLFL